MVHPCATVRSSAIRVVGVARTTLRSAAYDEQRRVGVEGGGQERLGGHEQHHELRAAGQRAPVGLAGERVDVGAELTGVALQVTGRLLAVVGGEGVEVGVERHLGVDDHRPAAREPHDHVGSLVPLRAGEVHLLLEVAVLDHAGQLDRTPQVQLAPLAAHVRLAQGGGERTGLAAEQVGGVPHVVDLLVQLALPRRALLLDVQQPLVEPVDARAEHGLVVTAGVERPQHAGIAGAAGPEQREHGAQQQPDHECRRQGKEHAARVTAPTDRLRAPWGRFPCEEPFLPLHTGNFLHTRCFLCESSLGS